MRERERESNRSLDQEGNLVANVGPLAHDHSREFVSFRFSFSSTYLPRWYRIELIAVKKNSETISTLPLRVISVAVSVVLAMVVERCGREMPFVTSFVGRGL